MKPDDLLAPLEWHLMTCVWDLGSANPIEVSQHLRLRNLRPLAPKTTGILLARLVDKGYLAVRAERRQGRGRPLHKYEPLMSRAAALRRQIDYFLDTYMLMSDEDIELVISLLETCRAEKV